MKVRVLCKTVTDPDEYYPLIFDCDVDPKDEHRLRRATLPTGFQGHFTSHEVWTFKLDAEGNINFDEPGWDPIPTTFLRCELRPAGRFTTVEEGARCEYEIRSITRLPASGVTPIPRL